METKSDFAQKLLYDLRLRKERLASAQRSGTYGSNRKILQGTKETKTLDIVGKKLGSTYKGSNRSQKTNASRESTNQLVTYGRGRQSGQGDISMALAYAFDSEGKLKRVDFKGNGAIMAFLQHQMGRKPMQQNLNTLWQTANQFPTLTHLHIDEIAKGAQKLNQILKACSNGLKLDQDSTEIGNELWKGAMELEQSLRMLVSLQEASEGMMSPQRKSSSLKLLENEDSEDKRTSQDKGKQVERPVFSFDKHSKNSKGTGQTGQQKNVLALTYLKEPPDIKSEKQADMTSKRSSHRRTASCGPELLAPYRTTPSKTTHNTARTTNVIAKLMGLEEHSHRTNTSVTSSSRTDTMIRSGEVDPTRILHRSSRSSEFKTVNANGHTEQNTFLSNKMSMRKSLELELLEDKNESPFESYSTTGDPLNQRWNGELRETATNHNRSTEAIFKINQLQGQITQLHQNNGSEGYIRSNLRLSSRIGQTQEKVTDAAEPKQRQLTVKSTNSKSTNKMSTEPLTNRETHGIENQAASKRLLHQQKQRKLLSGNESHGKKLKSEETRQEKSSAKRESRHMEGQKLKISQNIAYTKNLQKQAKAKKDTITEAGGDKISRSEALLNIGHYNDLTKCTNITSSEEGKSSANPVQQKSTTSNQEFRSAVTKVNVPFTSDAKPVGAPRQSMQGVTNPNFSRMANEVMTKTTNTTTKTTKQLKHQRPIICGIEQKHGKSNHQKDTSESNDSIVMTADTRRENPEAPNSEKSKQQVDAQQMATKDHITNEAQGEVVVQVFSEESFIQAAEVHEQEQQTGADVHIADPEKTTTAPSDGYTDNTDEAYNIQQGQKRPINIEKRKPLTDEERSLKQRLTTNQLFLNTAEALFKLDIPLNILNYASDHLCQEKEDKLTVECAYELLRQKGRRQEMLLYPVTNKFVSHRNIRSFDDLVKTINQDFMTLRSYGNNGREVYDDADYLLTMLERDIYYTDPEVNCMWDLGWRKLELSYVEIDEVISDVQSKVLEELLDEIVKDCMYISEFQRK